MRNLTKASRAAQFESLLKNGYLQETYKGLEIFKHCENLLLKVFIGTAANPALFYKYRSLESLEAKILDVKSNYDSREKYKAEQKEKNKGYKSSHAAAAAAIKEELKNKFPAYKFSVRSESFAGGDAVRISWENGPTNAEIELITGKYQMGHFNGMEDIYEYSNNNSNLPQSKYVTASRGYSEGLQNQIKMELESLYDFTNVSYRDSSENVAYRILSKTSFPAQYDSLKLVEFNDLEGNGIESFFKIEFSGVKVVEEKKTEATIQTDIKAEEIQVIEYSPKSFAVIGEKTKEIKEKLIELGGSYNRHLKCGAGFIFSNKRLGNVIEFLKSLKQVQEAEPLQEEEKTQETTLKEVFKPLQTDVEVQKFDNLEDLEEAAKGGQVISLLNMFELVRDENKKSPECSQVLQLMDKDHTYTDAVNLVCQSSQIDKNNLEVQLNKYI